MKNNLDGRKQLTVLSLQSRRACGSSNRLLTGGLGVGADQDISAGIRVDLKPISHVGITLGYAGIHVKVSDTVLAKTFTASQTLHGPILGIGFYF